MQFGASEANCVTWAFALSKPVSSSLKYAWQPLRVGVSGRTGKLRACKVSPGVPGTKEALTNLGLIHPFPTPSICCVPVPPTPQGLALALS